MIGERLKEIRNDHRDTQQMLADKLKVSKYTVQSWEQEKSAPSRDMLIELCKLYHVSADFLLGLTDEDPLFTAEHQTQLNSENQVLLKRFRAFLINEQRKESV